MQNPDKSGLEKAIDRLFEEMTDFDGDSEEYAARVKQLSKLYSLKEIDNPKPISRDTMLAVSGNLLGILIIVGYERANVATSKALNLLWKMR